MVLPAFTDDVRFVRELGQVAQKVGPVHGGKCTKSLERHSVTTGSEVA